MRPKSTSRRTDRLIARLAGRQHGVVARYQLLALGIEAGAIKRRIAAERLHVVHGGVYAVGHRKVSAQGRLLAAVLAGGSAAHVCDVSAAADWGFAQDDRGQVHIAATTRKKRKGIVFHEYEFLPGETATKNGIPITTPARTLLDCATRMRPATLEQALREALYLRRTSLAALRRLIHAHPGHRGTRKLGAAIARTEDSPGITRSELERWFGRFLRRHKLPLPELNVHIKLDGLDIEADCYWRAERLIVELDHRSTHARRHAFEQDRRRDRKAQAAGIRVVRVADEDRREEAALAADFSRLFGVAVRDAA